jgi:hypothetical protein
MLVRIIIGIIGIIIGFLIVWKAEKVVEAVGPMEWAEKFFGSGRSSTGYQMIGIIIIILAFIVMTNMIGGILTTIFGSTIKGLSK